MRKRGQFYLIAALVIIGLVTGLATIYNSIKVTEEDRTVYFLYQEANTESSHVVDQGVYNNLNPAQIEQNLFSLLKSYSAESPQNDFLTIYGNKTKATAYLYSQNQGSIGIDDGSGSIINLTARIDLGPKVYSANITGNAVSIKLDQTIYSFNLNEGETFYLLIKKDRSGERFVLTGEVINEG